MADYPTHAEVSTGRTAAIAAHAAAADPHADRADTTAKIATHAAAADPHGDRAFTTSAITTHAAAADPHGDRADAAAKYSDGRIWRSGGYYGPWGSQLATSQPNAGEVRFVPVLVPNSITLAEIAVYVSTAGSAGATVRLVVASDSGGRPGSILYCSSALAATATGKVSVTTPGVTLARGRYYFATVTQGAPATATIYASVQQVPEMVEQPDGPGSFLRCCFSWYGQTGALSGAISAGLGMDAGDAPRVQIKVT